MNGPLILTDKETILVLRARITELEAEVKAWESFGQESTAAACLAEQVAHLRPVLRAADVQAGGRAPAHILVMLLSQPGHYISRDRLFTCCQAVSGRGADEEGRSMDVRLSRLRRALAALGFSGVIHYERDAGWMINRTDAARLMAELFCGCNLPGCNTSLATVDA